MQRSLICQKVFILGTFKGMRINPRKNVHFSDKVGVGGSSPLIPTKGITYLSDFFYYLL